MDCCPFFCRALPHPQPSKRMTGILSSNADCHFPKTASARRSCITMLCSGRQVSLPCLPLRQKKMSRAIQDKNSNSSSPTNSKPAPHHRFDTALPPCSIMCQSPGCSGIHEFRYGSSHWKSRRTRYISSSPPRSVVGGPLSFVPPNIFANHLNSTGAILSVLGQTFLQQTANNLLFQPQNVSPRPSIFFRSP